jgi:glycosyltransferase involved in cell wall biosynthesis
VKILVITNMYPTARHPASGTFVEQQVKSLREIGLKVEVLFVDRLERGMVAYLGLGKKVREKLASFDADLVHCMYGGVMALQVGGAVTDRPTVVTFHGSDLLGEPLSGSSRRIVAGLGVRASLRAARQAGGVIVVSHALKQFLLGRVRARRVGVIPCGVDLQVFKPLDRDLCRNRLGWDKTAFHILFPANQGNPIKRPNLARAAMAMLHQRGLRAMLHPLQNVPHEEVPVWLNASDVLLMTSLHEGSPTVVKEAVACQIPVVSVDVGDVRERIEKIQGCHLAEATPCDLAVKLMRVLQGPRRLADRTSVQELALERIAVRIAAFYREVSQSRPAGLLKVERRLAILRAVPE